MKFNIEQYIAKADIESFCRQNNIRKIALFGSALRDELNPDSDIDLLVEFEEDHIPGLITLAGMEIELSDKIGRKVDLRTPRDLSRYFRAEVVRQAEVQYEAR
ncbi:MAG: nucleotidyltransferase domain-containing protein [Deltaproteobacteria bacterium]